MSDHQDPQAAFLRLNCLVGQGHPLGATPPVAVSPGAEPWETEFSRDLGRHRRSDDSRPTASQLSGQITYRRNLDLTPVARVTSRVSCRHPGLMRNSLIGP